jgi:integrase
LTSFKQWNGTPIKITKALVEADLKPGFYRDQQDKGFTLKVTPKLKRVYLVQRRADGRKMVVLTIGEHNSPHLVADKRGMKDEVKVRLTADVARKEAQFLIGQMRNGVNPKRVAETEKMLQVIEDQQVKAEFDNISYTVGEAFEDYLKTQKIRESTKRAYRWDFEKRCKDWLPLQLINITADMAMKKHREITEAGHPAQANSVMRILRAVFNLANETREWDAKNPTRLLKSRKTWNSIAPRENYITDEDLPAWFAAVLALQDDAMRDYFRLALLTGLRKNEALSLSWKLIDFKKRTLTVPKERAKNGYALTLPMSQYVHDLLEARYQRKDKTSDFVFPSSLSSTGYLSDMRFAEKIVTETSGVKASPHAWRRTFGQKAGEMLPELVVKALLNHRQKSDITQTHYSSLKRAEQLQEPIERLTAEILRLAGC